MMEQRNDFDDVKIPVVHIVVVHRFVGVEQIFSDSYWLSVSPALADQVPENYS